MAGTPAQDEAKKRWLYCFAVAVYDALLKAKFKEGSFRVDLFGNGRYKEDRSEEDEVEKVYSVVVDEKSGERMLRAPAYRESSYDNGCDEHPRDKNGNLEYNYYHYARTPQCEF